MLEYSIAKIASIPCLVCLVNNLFFAESTSLHVLLTPFEQNSSYVQVHFFLSGTAASGRLGRCPP